MGNDKALKRRAKLIRSRQRPWKSDCIIFQTSSTHGKRARFSASRERRLISSVAHATREFPHSFPGVETPGYIQMPLPRHRGGSGHGQNIKTLSLQSTEVSKVESDTKVDEVFEEDKEERSRGAGITEVVMAASRGRRCSDCGRRGYVHFRRHGKSSGVEFTTGTGRRLE